VATLNRRGGAFTPFDAQRRSGRYRVLLTWPLESPDREHAVAAAPLAHVVAKPPLTSRSSWRRQRPWRVEHRLHIRLGERLRRARRKARGVRQRRFRRGRAPVVTGTVFDFAVHASAGRPAAAHVCVAARVIPSGPLDRRSEARHQGPEERGKYSLRQEHHRKEGCDTRSEFYVQRAFTAR
jgi:hypothetical protein